MMISSCSSRKIIRRIFSSLFLVSMYRPRIPPFSSSTRLLRSFSFQSHVYNLHPQPPTLQNPNPSSSFRCRKWVVAPSELTSNVSFSFVTHRYLNTCSTEEIHSEDPEKHVQYETSEEVEPIDAWEEEDEAEPEIGDGGDGGGIVLQNCPWGDRVLSIAREVLLLFGEDMEIFAFKTTPRGYIYVRLDRLSNEYGCPSMDDIESYSREYKKRLDEVGADGEIPNDLALEVSSPGAERLLRIPYDLGRFKDMPMRVCYVDGDDAKSSEKAGVFFLDSIDTESESSVWRLADVKENRDPSTKGRPLSRKQKDWRLKLPHPMFKRVTLYLEY